MIQVSQTDWLAALRPGDICLTLGSDLFAKLQNLYRKKFNEGPLQASHGFLLTNPPEIIEADGLFVSRASIIKDVGNSGKCWVFRYMALTPEQQQKMLAYADGAVDAGGHYSVLGIAQFGLHFIGLQKKIGQEGGVFCVELTGNAIIEAKMPYISDRKPYDVTPSFQLNWFMGPAIPLGYQWAAHYDGAGKFLLNEILQPAA